MMPNMVMKDACGTVRPLIEVKPEEFEVLKKKYGELYGVPIYWCKNLGVLPKPSSPDFMFMMEE